MEFRNILSVATVLIFIIVFSLSKNKRRTFILFILFSFPFLDLNITPANLGDFKVFHLLTYGCLVFLFPGFKFHRNGGSIYSFLFWILSFILILGALTSEFVFDSLLALIKFLSIFIYAKLLIDECTIDSNFSLKIINILCIISVVSLIFLGFQQFYGLTFSFYGDLTLINVNNDLGGVIRYPSFFAEPQAYAQYLAMISFLFLIRIKGGSKPVIINYILYIFLIYGLFISGGRAGFGGLCIGLLVVLLLANQRIRLIGIVCILIGAIVVFSFSEYLTIFNRTETIGQSLAFRLARWKEALHIFEENPILGIGIDNYRNYVSHYLQNQYWKSNDIIIYYSHPENGYLKVLTEFGSIGFSLAFLFIVAPIRNALKRFRKGIAGFSSVLLIGSIITWIVSFLTVYTLEDLRIFVLLATITSLLIVLKDFPKTKNNTIEDLKR